MRVRYETLELGIWGFEASGALTAASGCTCGRLEGFLSNGPLCMSRHAPIPAAPGMP